jgi:hypothetical protein
MALTIDLNREEDYLVKATLTIGNSEINGVPCKIYLPERIHEKPYVLLKPLKQDANRIMASWKAGLKATIYGFDKEIQTTIEAPEVYFSGGSTRHWGDDISETTIPCEPQDLHIVRHLRNDDSGNKTHIVFWVSPNKFLTPFMICSNSYTGEIKCEKVRGLEFTIKDGQRLVFEKHFRYKTEKNHDLVRWSFLVACTEVDVPANDAESLKNGPMKDIDDFLLVASFAAKQRTACLGWTATDKNSYATFYRGNYTFPQPDDNISLEDGIIDIKDFQEFIETCYPAFLSFENKLALRNSLYAAVPSKPRTLENSFLSMFAGLETLILDFKRREGLEFVLPEPSWDDLKKYLKACIKKSTKPKLEQAQRASIYSKLSELNRVSLREAFDEFCKAYSIVLADLWPVFAENRETGLSDIRNKLIHGDPFPHDLIAALSIACEHLEYILQRVIVGVLGWDVKKTKLNPAYLQVNLCAIKELPVAQEQLSMYINSQEASEATASGEPDAAPVPKSCGEATGQPDIDGS